MSESLPDGAKEVHFLLLDCDGVLTDGGVILGSGGAEFKRFDIQDGMGISLARRAGIKVGVITGRASDAIRRRTKELNLDVLIEGVKDKVSALDSVLMEQGFARSEAAYMGDDIQDLAILGACGFSMAPANACAEVRKRVDFVTEARGGQGAVREAIEAILKVQGRWDDLVQEFVDGATPP